RLEECRGAGPYAPPAGGTPRGERGRVHASSIQGSPSSVVSSNELIFRVNTWSRQFNEKSWLFLFTPIRCMCDAVCRAARRAADRATAQFGRATEQRGSHAPRSGGSRAR